MQSRLVDIFIHLRPCNLILYTHTQNYVFTSSTIVTAFLNIGCIIVFMCSQLLQIFHEDEFNRSKYINPQALTSTCHGIHNKCCSFTDIPACHSESARSLLSLVNLWRSLRPVNNYVRHSLPTHTQQVLLVIGILERYAARDRRVH